MSDMTKATGLTKGSIYVNFENKDHVACEAFKHNLSALLCPTKFSLAVT